MAITRNLDARDILNQIVNDPRYPDVMRIPVLSLPQIALAITALSLFTASSLSYLHALTPLWVAIPLNVIAVYLAFTPLHDASHRAVSSNAFLNDFIGVTTGQLLLPAVNMTAFRAIHMDHHRYTGQEGRDPDTAFVKPPAFGLFYLMFADVHWVFWYLKYGRKLWSAKVGASIAVLLVAMVTVHAAFLMSPWWKEFLLLYVLPQRIGLGVVAYTFAHIQHPHGLTWEKEPFQSTMYIRGNSPLRRLLCGQEEHVIHHLTPHVPWFKYRRVWDLANGVLTRQGIPSRSWLFGTPDVKPAHPERTLSLKVTAVRDDAPSVRVIALKSITGEPLPSADAGAHIDLHFPGDLVRQYSLVEADAEHYLIAVKLHDKGRGGSRAAHQLAPGQVIVAGKPRNNFVLYENAPRCILIAGGIGVTPMIPMGRRLAALKTPFAMHVCVRDAASAPLPDMLRSPPLASHCYIHYDREDGRSEIDLDKILSSPDGQTILYICGPSAFMDWVQQTALFLGWRRDMIRVESFGSPIVQDAEDSPFTLSLARTHRKIRVRAEETAIDALAKAGIDVPFACMQGTCGTCVTPVLNGEIDHRDAYLSDEEKTLNDRLCLCVSRARGDGLELDL